MIDLEQLKSDIAQGEPSPRIVSVRADADGVHMSIVLSQASDPAIYADHIIYHGAAQISPKIKAYVRRFLRMAELEQAIIAAGQT